MRRREVMAAFAGLALSGCDGCGMGGAPAPVGSVGPTSTAKKADVIVIGAGMAGLSAARDLREAGGSVIVLEGRDRAGGRVFTDRSLGVPFDLGASWIHGTLGNPIRKLAKKWRLKRASSDYGNVHVFDASGKRMPDGTMGDIAKEWQALQGEVEGVAEGLSADVSIARGIKLALAGETLTAEEQRMLDWIVATQEVAAAEDLEKLSLLGDEDTGFPGGDELFPGGYDEVVKRVGDGTDVRLSHVVKRVDHGKQGVKVHTDKGIFEGRYALVTVPLGVLKRGSIVFAPALGAKRMASVRRLGMGTLNKVVLLFDDTFWPTDRDFLGYMSKTKREFPVFMNCRKFSDHHALMAFTGGSFARSTGAKTDKQVLARVQAILTTMFGSKARAPKGHLIARWSRDPFAYGSYSHVGVGATGKDFDRLAEPASDTLFFAGEATIRAHPGTVHGAYLSGQREAKRIASL